MNLGQRIFTLLVALSLAGGMLVWPALAQAETAPFDLAFDAAAWQYDAENDVYWQVGVAYCATPETLEYETLGIYVPGAYMTGTQNENGTYTCELNPEGTVNGYTADTAPIVIPVNTPGYMAMAAPTGYRYETVSSYLEAGFLYVQAGCRGRANGYDESGNLVYQGGAPWAVTDLKAAVRYLRYNEAALPGDNDRIFSFGMSGGGAQSALLGATGNSELYRPYLESIGAAMTDAQGNPLSDAIAGSMCWCPITALDQADAAYEWMLGQYSDEDTRAEDSFTSALSDDLSRAYADYLNGLGLTDEQGKTLTLTESESGTYAAGSYYDYLLGVVEQSLNHFLADTAFPYTSGGGMDGGGRVQPPDGGDMLQEMPQTGLAPDGQPPQNGMGQAFDGVQRTRGDGAGSEAVTYETAQDYIDALNADGAWIDYDETANTARISSLEAFVTNCKTVSKSVGAFDDLNRNQGENQLFGNHESDALHFDALMAQLLEQNQEEYAAYADWDAAYAQAYQEDMGNVDALGVTTETRQNMYNPMYYLSSAYEGYGTADVARYWRIRTGIEQGDTASTVEVNLALLLKQYTDVQDVDFETVWGQAHVEAERTGGSTENLIAWINSCLSGQSQEESQI